MMIRKLAPLALGALCLWLLASGCSSSVYSQAQGSKEQNRSPMAKRIMAIQQQRQRQGQ
jgi:hypothetical protein